MLAYRGEVWLPNMKCIHQYLAKYKFKIERYYTVTLNSDILSNPLVLATDKINDLLLKESSNPFVNNNQLTRLDNKYPFFKLIFNK
jgi:hypothetical protein